MLFGLRGIRPMNADLLYRRLDAARRRFLQTRSVGDIARSIGVLSGKWLRSDNSHRRRAIRRLRQLGYPEPIARSTLDDLFGQLRWSHLMRILRSEIGNPGFLDGFCRDRSSNRLRLARGPGVVTQVFPSNVPTAPIFSCVLAMLVKSASIAKTSSRSVGILDLYLQSLRLHDKGLAACCHLLAAGDRGCIKAIAGRSDLAVIYGSDRTVERFKKGLGGCQTRVIGYGHKTSFGFYLRDAFLPARLSRLAQKTALDVSAFNQEGCLSPKIFFVQCSDSVRLELFCRLLNESLASVWKDRQKRLCARGVWSMHRSKIAEGLTAVRGGRGPSVTRVPGTSWQIVKTDIDGSLDYLDQIHVVCLAVFGKTEPVLKLLEASRKHLQAVSLCGAKPA
ncbi:MAG: acyl-CoA reductase, partial [Candidatus Omnitrophota bacterium]